MIKKLVVGIGGASGVHLGLAFIGQIPKDIKLFVIASQSAKIVAKAEANMDLDVALHMLKNQRQFVYFDNENIASSIASGSFGIDAMAIIPTSMNLLAKVACGLSDDLISRVAAVMLKQKRVLLLAPREMPLSPIALRQMSELSMLNVIIAPPIAGYYAAKDLAQMERFFVGKWLDALGIDNTLYKRWQTNKET